MLAPQHEHRRLDERQVARDVAVQLSADEGSGNVARPGLVADRIVVRYHSRVAERGIGIDAERR